MKEARYLIRLANPKRYTPSDQTHLRERVRDTVAPLGASTANLRVSHSAVEFDLFCPPSIELHRYLNALEPLGAVLTYKRLDGPAGSVLAGDAVAEARRLFNEERFWEVHEVLEALWKPATGTEKRLLQGLILVAAALVHVQKNEPHVTWPMLEDAVERLEDQPSVYFGLDVQRLLREVRKIIATKTLHFPTI